MAHIRSTGGAPVRFLLQATRPEFPMKQLDQAPEARPLWRSAHPGKAKLCW